MKDVTGVGNDNAPPPQSRSPDSRGLLLSDTQLPHTYQFSSHSFEYAPSTAVDCGDNLRARRGVFDHIRDLFAQTKLAKQRGYEKGRFSFNVKEGRCEECGGQGTVKIEMNFLSDVYVPCEACDGERYNNATLDVTYKDKTISDVLDMEVGEAYDFFEANSQIRRRLKLLKDVGLDYMTLGQPSTTLSGGEAQRVKLAEELGKKDSGETLYLLDEPTTGLHHEDERKLIEVLHRLTDNGNTVAVIEHELDLVKNADHIIDLGPEGGEHGGELVATGTPEDVARLEDSHTGRYLRDLLPKIDLEGPRGERVEPGAGRGDDVSHHRDAARPQRRRRRRTRSRTRDAKEYGS